MLAQFSYDEAFVRNIGWFTNAEQAQLRSKRIAIAGLGGVGGYELQVLVRLGIGNFHIADLDTFDQVNFNRQIGATMQTLGRPKAKVMEEMAHSINPEINITTFDSGVTDSNLDEFLREVDLFVDGFDFFVIGMRRRVFARCAELGIPAVTAAPIGMGSAYLAFLPGEMSFEQYFKLEGQPEVEQYRRFYMGLAPEELHRPYLVDPSRLDLNAKTAPSTAIGCVLSAGVTGMMAVKLLLGRGEIKAAPHYYHFDAYSNKFAIGKRRPESENVPTEVS